MPVSRSERNTGGIVLASSLRPITYMEGADGVSFFALPHERKRLLLTDNLMTKIPDQVLDLTSTVDLNVARNELRELPEGFARLERLRTIDLSSNLFTVPNCSA